MIRRAEAIDLFDIHALGCAISELRVSDSGDFMSQDELMDAIRDPSSVFLVYGDGIEEYRIRGFAYARVGDLDRVGGVEQACFVYLAVDAKERRQGVGDILCRRMMTELAIRGVKHVYTWAHTSSGVIQFMERHGFVKGHACVWMEREIAP